VVLHAGAEMRIALCLRGHARTWRSTAAQWRAVIAALPAPVDVYACVWQSRTFGPQEMEQLAQQLPITQGQLVGPRDWDVSDTCDGYTAPSWQGARLAMAMRATGGEYAAVIDTRLDIWPALKIDTWAWPTRGVLCSTKLEDPWMDAGRPGIEDHLLVMHGSDHWAWCQRHHRRYQIPYNHCILHQYCSDQGWAVDTVPWIHTEFVRANWPQWPDQTMDPANLSAAHAAWIAMAPDQRRLHCLASGIDPAEYSAPFHVGEIA
jgi:hypothetical protein